MINTKQDIWIEGFDSKWQFSNIATNTDIFDDIELIIYEGKTSEIPEEIAKECVKSWQVGGLYQNYKMDSQYQEYMFKTAKDSIQSACDKEFCIIFRK